MKILKEFSPHQKMDDQLNEYRKQVHDVKDAFFKLDLFPYIKDGLIEESEAAEIETLLRNLVNKFEDMRKKTHVDFYQ